MGLEGIQQFNKDHVNINDNKNTNNGEETCSPSSSGSSTIMDGVPSKFPAGLRVMVVDDDPVCLQIINKMLKACQYQVTTCNQASTALTMLREKKDSFDLVLSDVYMPDMDGFQLLELIGLEMDLPVIMMSADGETSVVMKGIKHGACDYLLKPIRIEALKTIWQHVIRKKNHNEPKEVEHSGSVEEDDRKRKGSDDLEYASSINEGNSGLWKTCKRKKDSREDEEDGDQENDDSSTLKKPRVVWSVDLHQQFVHAVNQLGIDKAVPKRILELMNVQGLTRENVASHLQKYRLYLKKINGNGQSQSGFNPSSFVGSPEMNFGPLSPLERHELQPFSTSRQTLGGGGMIGQLHGNEGTSPVDIPFLFQPEIQGLNCSLTERLRFGQHSLGREKSYLQGLSTGIDFKGISPSFEHLPSFGKGGFSDVAGFPVQLASSPRSFGPFGGVNNIGVLASPHSNGTIHNQSMYHPSQNLSAPPTPHPLLHLPRRMPGGLGHHQGNGRGQNEGSDGLHMLNLPSSNILNQQLLPSDGITSPLSMIVNGNNGGMGSRHLPIVESHTDGDLQNCGFSIPKTPMASLGDMGMAQGNNIMENHANSGYVYDQNKNKPLWHGQSGMHNGDCNSDQDLEFSQSLQGVDNNGIPGLMIEGHEGDSKMGMKLQNDHLVDNSLSLKEDRTSSLMGNSDLDGRLLHEPLDDIMSVLKQQQEEEDTFSDGEFTNDMYQLDATSMK